MQNAPPGATRSYLPQLDAANRRRITDTGTVGGDEVERVDALPTRSCGQEAHSVIDAQLGAQRARIAPGSVAATSIPAMEVTTVVSA